MMFLSAKDFAKEVNLPYKTVKALCRSGVLPVIKSGRVYNVNVAEGKKALTLHSTMPTKAGKRKIDYMAELNKITRGA